MNSNDYMGLQVADEHQKEIYRKLLSDMGLEEDRDSELIFTGPADPFVDSPYYLGAGFAALAGAVGMTNEIIWRMRGGKGQKITVDRQKAMYHLYRMQFLRQHGYRVLLSAPFKYTGLTHRCKDGRFIETLTTLRHLEDGMLELLDCLNKKEAVDAAFMKWNAYDLEEEINKRGLCGAVVRSKQEWREHPQGKALLDLPVITIEKIANSEPIPFKAADRPLRGIQILDLSYIIAGPTIGNVLAEQGAEVLHINRPNSEQILTNIMDSGWGKLSAYLNLDDPADVSRLNDLIKDNCDVFIQSYRPDALNNRGFTPEKMAELRPGIIRVDVSAYGHIGPWASRKAWENIAQACTGIMVDQGSFDSPRLVPGFLTDYSTGYFAALGILTALIRRAREGGSYHVRVSLAQGCMWYQDLGYVSEAERGKVRRSFEEEFLRCFDPRVGDGFNDHVELMETDTPFGRLTHMAPITKYSETPAYWERPTVPLGYHRAEWSHI
jgi:crotonobetainyl-CoA:carnitine CoA-transferase CaiB-like acyl-CoA transferase